MQAREIELPSVSPPTPDLTVSHAGQLDLRVFLRRPRPAAPTIATLAFWHGRWEAYPTLLGSIFTTVAIVASRCRFEMTILRKSGASGCAVA